MNIFRKLISDVKCYISKKVNRKIEDGVGVSYDSDIRVSKKVLKEKKPQEKKQKNITPIYNLKQGKHYFELYGNVKSDSGKSNIRLLHIETGTYVDVSEKLFTILFEKEDHE